MSQYFVGRIRFGARTALKHLHLIHAPERCSSRIFFRSHTRTADIHTIFLLRIRSICPAHSPSTLTAATISLSASRNRGTRDCGGRMFVTSLYDSCFKVKHQSDEFSVTDRLVAEIIYRPRARAYRPILSSPFPFSSTIKAVPEEWRQIPSEMISYPSQSHLEPIDCLVSLPGYSDFRVPSTIIQKTLLRPCSSSSQPSRSTP